MILSDSQKQFVASLVGHAGSVVIVCHMTPDGDALGSSLCLCHLLQAMGKNSVVVTPDAFPESLAFLPGTSDIVVASYTRERAAALIDNADLIVCLDFNDLRRIDRLGELIARANAPRIVIDHHLNPAIEAEVLISHPEVSSTCALLYQVVEHMGWADMVGLDSATCCCVGMMTDTGNFSYNSNDPQLYRILAALVAKGVDKDALYTRLFNTNSETRIRIMGFAQSERMKVYRDRRYALITLSRADLDRFDYHRGDTEGLVNIPLSIPGIRCSVFLREDEPGFVKVSMRSKGDFSVKALCEDHFSGGGHLNASGGEMRASLDEVVAKVESLFPVLEIEA